MNALTQETVDAWHRGECKMPGGKLVAVSVCPERADGAIQARIDGDFFVEGDAEAAHGLLRELESAIGAYAHTATVLPLASQRVGGSATCERPGHGKLESDGTDASGTPAAGSGTMPVQSVESAGTDGTDGMARPGEVGRSSELDESIESDGLVESAGTVGSDNPVESGRSVGVDDPVGLGRSLESEGPVESGRSAESGEPVESSESAESVRQDDPSESAERITLGRSVQSDGPADPDGPAEALARRLEAVIAGHPTVMLIGASARTIATAAVRALARERVAGPANACDRDRGALAETRRTGSSVSACGTRAPGVDRRTSAPERTVFAHGGEAARPGDDPDGTRPARSAHPGRSEQSTGPVQSAQRIDPARSDAGSDARPVPDARLVPHAPVSPAAPDSLTVLRDVPRSPAMQLALDQSCAEAVAAGHMGPLIRLWQWDRAAVVIGRFQSLRNEVNLEQARAEQVTVVRRITGGGAMFAEPESVITYSLVAPLGWVAGLDVEESYRRCDRWVLDALRSLGIEACYRPINDIASPLGKIGGAAQRRFAPVRTASGAGAGSGTGNAAGPGAVLHHTMLSYDMDAAKMVRILRISREKMSDKAVKSAVKRVDPLRLQTGLTRAQVLDRMVATLTDPQGPYRAQYAGPDRADATLGAAVLDRAADLVRTRFAAPAWTAIIP